MHWGITDHINHLQKLLTPRVIGNYRSFEVTEIFGFHRDTPRQITNFMSLLVAEPGEPPPEGQAATPDFLNGKKPIELRGTSWKFGIARYRISTQQVLTALQNLSANGEWKPGTFPLKVGTLTPVPPQFVPADSAIPHPWNGVLKNNFWEGSHVLELFDAQKEDVKFLLTESQLLKELAADIMAYAKISIDGLSDRLGNVLIQLPVTVVTTKISNSNNGDFLVQPIWHHGTSARPLRLSCEKYEDATVEGFGSQDVTSSLATIPIHSPGGGARYVLWDANHQLVLGASAETSFFTSIAMNLHIMGAGPTVREFKLSSKDGVHKMVTVPLIEEQKPSIIGKPTSKPWEPWRNNRVFRDSLKSMRERREFVQYGGNSGYGAEKAFDDIHVLLREHGKDGAWLWDPYLDARDVLATLFYCPHKGADLRALTAGAEPPVAKEKESNSKAVALCQRAENWLRTLPFASWIGLKPQAVPPPKQSWKDEQLETFKNSMGNCQGLRLEFRIRKGSAGWSFHDRFLIFPSATGPATAWSLGTSVNSFGQKHHILQKVADGELIRIAFLDLWNELNDNDYLVWSTP